MWMYREAAVDSFKRQISIYGIGKVSSIALASGYRLDSNGNIVSVENEEEAFKSLCGSVERELGPLAALSCRTALIKASSRETSEFMAHIAGESLNIVSAVSDINKSLSLFKLPADNAATSGSGEAATVTKGMEPTSNRMKFEREPYPAISFLQKIFGWAF